MGGIEAMNYLIIYIIVLWFGWALMAGAKEVSGE
jgi:hypothetical protein